MTALRLRPPPALDGRASARIDLLRLFLVAQVVCGHLAMLAYPSFGTLDFARAADLFVAGWRLATRFGGEAAIVFVCISGYFLGPRLLAAGLRQSDAEPLGSFLRGRLLRIYPTLVAALLLTLACDLAGIRLLGAEPVYRRIATYDAVATLDGWHFIANLLSLQPVFSASFGSNGPLWTLGYIVQFYVAAAALAAVMRHDRRLAALVLAALLAAGFWYHPAWPLLFGCWLGCGVVRWVRPQSSRRGWAALVAGLVLLVGANLLPFEASIPLCGLASALFLIGATARLEPGGPERLPGWLQRLNAASFPLYAFHYPLALLLYVALLPHVAADGLAFRLAWPVIALGASALVALPFQAALERWQSARAS